MKATYLAVIFIVCVATMPASRCRAASHWQQAPSQSPSDAARAPQPDGEHPVPNSDEARQKDRKVLNQRTGRGTPDTNRQHGLVTSATSASVVKRSVSQNGTVRPSFLVRSRVIVRPAVPSTGTVRHHSPNPPVVGGFGNATTKSTGAISGSQMNRKP
jgi:hypothetical protein